MSGTLSSKGQITVPKAVRDALGLKSGDAVDFVIKDGQAILRPRKVWKLDEVVGSLNRYARRPPFKDQREEDAALAKAMRPHLRKKFFGEKA